MGGRVASVALSVVIGKESSPILPATNELIWGTVAFVLLLLILWRAGVFKRIAQTLADRTDRIQGNIQRAEQARKEARELLERHRRQLDEARDEARRILDEARQTAEQLRRDIHAQAQEESNRIIEGARREIRAERDRAARELRREMGVLAVRVAERVVGQELDADRHRQLIDDYIEELGREAAGNGSSSGGSRGRS
jgi:F-type H+-transporting ATPase subunit b